MKWYQLKYNHISFLEHLAVTLGFLRDIVIHNLKNIYIQCIKLIQLKQLENADIIKITEAWKILLFWICFYFNIFGFYFNFRLSFGNFYTICLIYFYLAFIISVLGILYFDVFYSS